jgi:transcriptional regulator
LSTEVEQLEWRRCKVVEMRARCLSQTEIAHELQVSKALISSDVQYLRKQAKETIESKNILFISKIRYDILCKQLQRYHVR